MSLTRDHMLRELELLPAWKRNGLVLPTPAALGHAAELESAEVVSSAPPVLETGLDIAAAAQPVVNLEAKADSVSLHEDTQVSDSPQPLETLTAEPHPILPPEALPAREPEPVASLEITAQEIAPIAPSLFEHDLAAEADMDAPFVTAPPAVSPSEIEPQGDLLQIDLIPEQLIQTSTPQDDRAATILRLDWLTLQQDVPGCTACNLAATRKQTVFGVGDPDADWLIVGEAPGAEEDRRGEPFVGLAGQLLDNMLAAIQLQRGKNVYIANVLKCRPPENRDPHGVEVAQCDPYLKRQVELIQPKLILALGKFAAQSLLDSSDTIAAMRGKLHHFAGVPVIVTYHPAYLLRNLPDKAKAWEDLCFARSTMQALQEAAPALL